MNNKCECTVKKKCIVIDKIFSLLMMPGILFSLLLPLIVFYDIIPESKEILITIIICLIVTELTGGYIIIINNSDKYGKNIDSTGEYSLNYIQQWNWDGLFSITGLWIGGLFFSWWCVLTTKTMFTVHRELDFMESFLFGCSLVFGFIIAVLLWYNIKRIMLCKIKRILNNK